MPSNAPAAVRKTHLAQKGFSLIELLVVVAIIGVLAGAGVYAYSIYIEATREKVAVNNIEVVRKALETDIAALSNSLTGRSSLLSSASGPLETCEQMAVEVVKSLQAKNKNPYTNTSVRVAAYANALTAGPTPELWMRDGFRMVKGEIYVACADPGAKVGSEEFLMYQCVCTSDACAFDTYVEPGRVLDPKTCPIPVPALAVANPFGPF